MGSGHADAFPPTRPSVVRSIGSVDPDVRRDAYDALVRQYWRPVYAYIRLRWHRDPVEAQDLTQEFFTRAFEKEYLEKYDPGARTLPHVRADVPRRLSRERASGGRRG